MANKMEDFGY